MFTYGAQESPATFMDLSYVPMFIDNITWTNDSFRFQAEKVCGNNTNCLFDAAVTVDTSYGMATKKLEENNNEVNRELGKIFEFLFYLSYASICYVIKTQPANWVTVVFSIAS